MDESVWIARAAVAVVGGVTLIAALVLVVLQQGVRRAALVAGLLPAALLAPVVATMLAAFGLTSLFQGMAQGAGGMTAILAGMVEVWGTVRLGFGLAALVGRVGLLGGFARWGAAGDAARPSSARRSLVLVVLPCAALLIASLQARELRLAITISQAVVADTGSDAARKASVESYL